MEKRNLQMGALQLQQMREGRLRREAGNFYGQSRWNENFRQEEIWSELQQEAFLREMQCRFARNQERLAVLIDNHHAKAVDLHAEWEEMRAAREE